MPPPIMDIHRNAMWQLLMLECRALASGTFQANTGASDCQPCPAHLNSSAGSTSKDECSRCLLGASQDECLDAIRGA